MSESETRPGRRVGPVAVWATALGLLAMPVLYMLSIGPMIWVYHYASGLPVWAKDAIVWYAFPMEAVLMYCPFITPWVMPYFELWY